MVDALVLAAVEMVWIPAELVLMLEVFKVIKLLLTLILKTFLLMLTMFVLTLTALVLIDDA